MFKEIKWGAHYKSTGTDWCAKGQWVIRGGLDICSLQRLDFEGEWMNASVALGTTWSAKRIYPVWVAHSLLWGRWRMTVKVSKGHTIYIPCPVPEALILIAWEFEVRGDSSRRSCGGLRQEFLRHILSGSHCSMRVPRILGRRDWSKKCSWA